MVWRAYKGFPFGWLVSASLLAVTAAAAEQGGDASFKALENRFDQTDSVSVVKVKHISELINPALSSAGMVVVEGYVYTGQVVHNWKGAQQPHFKLQVNLSHCRARLTAGNEYVVFSQRMDHSRLQSFSCEDMVPREEAAELMLALDKLSELQVAKRNKGDKSSI